jgi:HTH-type transcriptional regulator/antitoxin HigA
VEPLLDKGEARTAEETALAEVLVALISRYEQSRYNPLRSKPHELLEFLMKEHDLRQRDLLDVFPTRSRVSEVLSGKRAITKEQAMRLGQRFGVDASAFIAMPG